MLFDATWFHEKARGKRAWVIPAETVTRLPERHEDLPIDLAFMSGRRRIVSRYIASRMDEVWTADERLSDKVVYLDRSAFRDKESYFK